MRFQLRQSEGRTAFELNEGTLTLGGGPTAQLQVPMLGEESIQLSLDGVHWSFIATLPSEISGVPLHAQIRRLVLPGECVRIGSFVELRAEVGESAKAATEAPATHSLLKLWFEPQEQKGPRLMCLTGLDAGRTYALGPETLTVGRALHVGIRVRDRGVSRLHLLLEMRGAQRWAVPSGSGNPVMLNGSVLSMPHALEHGDVLSLGYSQLRYVDPLPEKVPEVDGSAEVAVDTESALEPALTEAPASGRRWPDWRWMLAGSLLVVLGALMRMH